MVHNVCECIVLEERINNKQNNIATSCAIRAAYLHCPVAQQMLRIFRFKYYIQIGSLCRVGFAYMQSPVQDKVRIVVLI